MSWRLVARWTARDALRTRGRWAVTALLAGTALAATLLPAVVLGDALSADGALAFLVAPLKTVVALAALLAGYGAVAGPRSGGQLRLLLGLPVDRTALVVGAFVGRTSVVLGGVAVGLAVVAVTLPLAYGTLPLGRLAGFGVLLALLAVSVTGLAVGLSAAAGTRGGAAVAAVATFAFLAFFWGVVPAGAHYLVEGTLPGPVVPAWVVLLERSQPLAAFQVATDLVLPGAREGIQLSAAGAAAADPGTPPALEDRLAGPPPCYLDPWAAVATLVVWTVGPLAVGWHRFRGADL